MRPISLLLIISVLAFASAANAVSRPGATTTGRFTDTNLDGSPTFKELEGKKREKEIARVEKYLSSLTTVTSNFTQTSSDGTTGSGTFYLKRPGKMRWEYNPPMPILLVSNGKTITYYDPGVNQVSYISVEGTLAGFLAREDVTLDNDLTQLTRFGEAKGLIRATLIQRKKPDEGTLTLEFTDNPLTIAKIITVDATGNETQVTLSDTTFGGAIDKKLFVFKDPRGVNAKRNKKK